MTNKDVISDIDLRFIQLVKERRYKDALEILTQVKNINIADELTHLTALHFAALRSAAGFIERLQTRDDLNYLVKDKKGRYPSELAWEVSGDEELGAALILKEKEQAEHEGIQAWPKPPPPAC